MKNRQMPMLLAATAHSVEVAPWSILPFAVLLLMIAAGPMFFEKWWHHHYPKVAVGLGLITILYYIFALQAPGRLLHVGHEYISFISLIGSLFVVAGGIHIQVKGEARPLTNVIFLFLGAISANFIGTTGASMLLIRPWIRTNRYRIATFHVVFFIFIVSNVGGCLTPIGDPPLFLGFLKGVPFFWVLEHCWVAWLIVLGMLLAMFYIFDSINYRKPPREIIEEHTGGGEEWRFDGLHNILFIVIITAAVLGSKVLPLFVPDAIMIGAAIASFLTTSRAIHRSNAFNFEPIREVAWLFVGIFATMIPALDYLEKHAASIGLDSSMQFYWATGALSAFLDNAPTYLTFLAAAMGDHGLSLNIPADVLAFVAQDDHILIAISLAAVFFGAGTYIGNGPNFMVKNIAQQSRVHTPSFAGYLFRYAIPILLPIYALIGLLFFSKWHIF
ncbi:sodium:proton antiporter [soil metagenome]